MTWPECGVNACPVHGNPELLQYDWLRRNAHYIHYFGLGFIQVKITKSTRMHFYTSELERIVDEEEVHDHRYEFRSDILKGMLFQNLYRWGYYKDATHSLEKVSCKPDEPAPSDSQGGRLTLLSSSRMSAGSNYTISHDTFHQVWSLRAITFLHIGPVVKQFANVARKIGNPTVCPFSRKVPEERLWEVVRSMM